jgi:hypothetical protein
MKLELHGYTVEDAGPAVLLAGIGRSPRDYAPVAGSRRSLARRWCWPTRMRRYGLGPAGGASRHRASHRPKGFASPRRVLRTPARWSRIVDLAAALGERLPPEPSAPALQAFLGRRRQADPARFADVSLSVVKLLGSGEYAVELPGGQADGHFGLAVKDYTHSTAPNRRFPDLATQRLVKAVGPARASVPSDGSRPNNRLVVCLRGAYSGRERVTQ